MRLAAVALLLAGIGLNAREPARPPPAELESACREGNVAEVERLLAAGADPDGAGEGAPMSPLVAALLGLPADDDRGQKIVRLLLDHGADPNQPADVRPLYAAILRGHVRAATALLGAGANPDLAGAVRSTLPDTVLGESSRALAARRGEPWVALVGGAQPKMLPAKPKKKELKRPTLCSDS